MLKLELLSGVHDKSNFDSGNDDLNRWLTDVAGQHMRKGLSRTTVLLPLDHNAVAELAAAGHPFHINSILGFHALSAANVSTEAFPADLARGLPRETPVTRLGRLAVDHRLHGQGLGQLLLADALTRARSAAAVVGSAGIIVDAKNSGAAAFYAKFGFQSFIDDQLKLFMPMG